MPSCRFAEIDPCSTQLLWHITEPEEVLVALGGSLCFGPQTDYRSITHPTKRKEWLAARLALKALLVRSGYTCTRLQKDVWGRPYLLSNSVLHLSIAHSFPFALVAISHRAPIGVDIQRPSEKLKNVQEKFLDGKELQDSGNDLKTLCTYWCAKEAIYKAQGGRNLSLKQDIHIDALTQGERGTAIGTSRGQRFTVRYHTYAGYMLASGQKA